MPPVGSRWSRDELLLVLHLYHRTPFGRMHHRNPEVVALAEAIGRSASAVAYKLANFAALDPGLDRRGMANYSKADEAVWREFEESPEEVIEEAESRVRADGGSSLLTEAEAELPVGVDAGERTTLIRARVSQGYFRRMVLARFDATCCMTGLRVPQLLVASHIVRWADDPRLRLRPENGLCLNALHDRAFETGIVQIDDELRIRVRDDVKSAPPSPARDLILQTDGALLVLPTQLTIERSLLARHRARFAHS